MTPIKLEQADQLDVRHWIANKIKGYEESPRAGIPRGDDLPIPKHKHSAAILMLLYGGAIHDDLAQIARIVGCTYSLIGKWRTERRFWSMAERAADEYLDQFLKAYLWLANESLKNEEEAGRLIGDLLSLLERTWGEILFERAYDKINRVLRNEKLPIRVKHQVYYLAISCAKHWKDEKLKAEIVEKCKDLHASTVETFKELGRRSLEKGDKAGVVEILEILAGWATEANSDFLDVAFGVPGKKDEK